MEWLLSFEVVIESRKVSGALLDRLGVETRIDEDIVRERQMYL